MIQAVDGSAWQADKCHAVQNLDGTIGRLLPKRFKDKVRRAMDEGIDAVFGKVQNKVPLHAAMHVSGVLRWHEKWRALEV